MSGKKPVRKCGKNMIDGTESTESITEKIINIIQKNKCTLKVASYNIWNE